MQRLILSPKQLALYCLVVFSCLSAGTSANEILDLDVFAAGSQQPDGITIPAAGSSGISAQLDNFLDKNISFFDSNYISSRVFCFNLQFGCGMSGAVYFSEAVEDVSLEVEQTSTLSNVRIDAYFEGGIVESLFWNDITASPSFGPTRLFDFSGAGLISALVMNSLGDTAFYGNFRFTEVSTAVPEPSSLLLLAFSLALLSIRPNRIAAQTDL